MFPKLVDVDMTDAPVAKPDAGPPGRPKPIRIPPRSGTYVSMQPATYTRAKKRVLDLLGEATTLEQVSAPGAPSLTQLQAIALDDAVFDKLGKALRLEDTAAIYKQRFGLLNQWIGSRSPHGADRTGWWKELLAADDWKNNIPQPEVQEALPPELGM
ncbi:hypothetical protein LTR65_007662 [Meristemomyces frigidus]